MKDFFGQVCDEYADHSPTQNLCLWFNRMKWLTVICYSFIVLAIIIVTFRKLRGKNEFVIVFVIMIAISMILDLFSLFPRTNYALQYLKVYYYASVDATETQLFVDMYQFVGYIYYIAQTIFLVAHWLFGFVYLFTALNLGYQLQID